MTGPHGAAASGSSARAPGVVPDSVWVEVERVKMLPEAEKAEIMRTVFRKELTPYTRNTLSRLPTAKECVDFLQDFGTDKARARIAELQQELGDSEFLEYIPVECIAKYIDFCRLALTDPTGSSPDFDRSHLLTLFEFGHLVRRDLSLLDTLNNSDLWDHCRANLHNCLR